MVIRVLEETRPSGQAARRYRRAATVLDTELRNSIHRWDFDSDRLGRDVLDTHIRSEKSLNQVWSEASDISKRWGVVTSLTPKDFRAALEEADVR